MLLNTSIIVSLSKASPTFVCCIKLCSINTRPQGVRCVPHVDVSNNSLKVANLKRHIHPTQTQKLPYFPGWKFTMLVSNSFIYMIVVMEKGFLNLMFHNILLYVHSCVLEQNFVTHGRKALPIIHLCQTGMMSCSCCQLCQIIVMVIYFVKFM